MNMYNPHELYHHGILGMKWGVRRFQNKDGTLTPAGRKRKAKLEAQYEKVTGKKVVSEDPQSKPRMPDDELRARIARVKAENDLMDQQIAWNKKYAELHPPSVVKEFIEKSRDKVVDKAVDWALDAGRNWLDKKTGVKTDSEKQKSEHDRLKEQAETLLYKQQIKDRAKDLYGYDPSSGKEQTSPGSSSKNDSKESNPPKESNSPKESTRVGTPKKERQAVDVDFEDVVTKAAVKTLAPVAANYVAREADRELPTLQKEYKEPINAGRTYANELLALPPRSGGQYASLREIAKRHGVTGLRY